MLFVDNVHKEAFMELLYKYGKYDDDYLAAFYICSSTEEIRRKTFHYIDEQGIDFEAILSNGRFGSGHTFMICAAKSMFGQQEKVDLSDICRCDRIIMKVLLEAWRLRAFGLGEIESIFYED